MAGIEVRRITGAGLAEPADREAGNKQRKTWRAASSIFAGPWCQKCEPSLCVQNGVPL